MTAGFAVGIVVNGYEVYRGVSSNFDMMNTFIDLQPTYHIGRLGIAMGYIGLIGWLMKRDVFADLKRRLAAIGQMALTNYLMHSVICAILFTGLGFGLVGELSRAQLYPVVLGDLDPAVGPKPLVAFPFQIRPG